MGEDELDIVVEAIAAEDAPALLAEARAEAAAQVRAALVRRISEALLRRCEDELTGQPPQGGRDAEAGSRRGDEEAAEPHPLVERARDSARGCYVYGVVAIGTRLPSGLTGVDPELPVRLVESGALAAIVSEVPSTEFGEETIREKLNDVAWLEEKARAHEEVLESALESTAVVPLRLCTVFNGEEQVREMLARERAVLLDALDRLAGKAEWGVKAYAYPEALEREAASRDDEPDGDEEASSGTAYLNRKRRQARAREEAEEVADEWARAIHERLAGAAAEALLNPLQRPELSGHEAEMLLNGVYLVADAEATGFREVVAALGDVFDRRGVEVVLTGPWPAYNFVKSSIEAAR